MNLIDVLKKTRVALGCFDHPTCGIGLLPTQVEHVFLTFSYLDEKEQKLSFGEIITPVPSAAETSPDDLLDAVFFENPAAWDNFVLVINKLDKQYKAWLSEKENEHEGLHDGTS